LARSKINEYSGAKTQFSGVALSFFTFLATKYLLKPFAWLPVQILLQQANGAESVIVGSYFDRVFEPLG
jgi:hypothetical protein